MLSEDRREVTMESQIREGGNLSDGTGRANMPLYAIIWPDLLPDGLRAPACQAGA